MFATFADRANVVRRNGIDERERERTRRRDYAAETSRRRATTDY